MCNLFQTRQWGIVLFFVMLLVAPFVSLAQERTLEGTVVDATNQPLKGVSVTIDKSKKVLLPMRMVAFH